MKKVEGDSGSNAQEDDEDEQFFSDESSFYGKKSFCLHVSLLSCNAAQGTMSSRRNTRSAVETSIPSLLGAHSSV